MASRRWVPRFRWRTLFVVIIAYLIVNYLVALPYFVIGPGSTEAVQPLLQVPPDKAHVPKGRFLLTTVSLKQAHPTDIVVAWLTKGTEIEEKKQTIGDLSKDEYLKLNDELMESSKLAAVAAAMNRAGYDAKPAGEGARIREILPDGPSAGKLNPGETIIGVNGSPISLALDLTVQIQKLKPGVMTTLEVADAQGAKRTETITTASRPPDGRTIIGVSITTKNPRLDTPFPVNIKETNIGGPSAGLAFALSLLDDLTPGELSGGGQVAVTGTIEPDGTVGPVGGVVQKSYTVNKSRARLFLVPFEELDQARKFADKDVKVVGVKTLSDAVNVLGEQGADTSGLPKVAAN